jgi:hypothetical protein
VERLFERVRTGDIVELHAERPTELDEVFAAGMRADDCRTNSR